MHHRAIFYVFAIIAYFLTSQKGRLIIAKIVSSCRGLFHRSPENIAENTNTSSLENGKLPDRVEQRILRQKQHLLPWTSNASVSDWLLMRKMKMHPLGLVSGCAHFVAAYTVKDVINNFNIPSGFPQEIFQCSAVIKESCDLALHRLRQEAALHEAHAVVNVKLKRMVSMDGWGNRIEFQATGTAIRFEDAAPLPEPLLLTVSMDEYLKLMQLGSTPLGISLGVSYYYGKGSESFITPKPLLGLRSYEVSPCSKMISLAHHAALKHLEHDAKRLGGSEVIGHSIDFSVVRIEREGSSSKCQTNEFAVQFFCLGTVLGQFNQTVRPKIKMVLDLAQV